MESDPYPDLAQDIYALLRSLGNKKTTHVLSASRLAMPKAVAAIKDILRTAAEDPNVKGEDDEDLDAYGYWVAHSFSSSEELMGAAAREEGMSQYDIFQCVADDAHAEVFAGFLTLLQQNRVHELVAELLEHDFEQLGVEGVDVDQPVFVLMLADVPTARTLERFSFREARRSRSKLSSEPPSH